MTAHNQVSHVSKNHSEKKSSKENCSESYHALFEQATDAILITDFQGNFKDVNTSMCNLFGYTKEELLQMNVRSLLDADHLKNSPIRFDLLAQGENVFNERKMVHRTGRIIDVEANAKKVLENRIMVIARDITERKKVEEILHKSEANLHTIFDSTDTIYVLMDTELRVISFNPRAASFFRHELSKDLQTGGYFPGYFPDARQPVILRYMSELMGGRQVSYEINYAQADGSVHWYDVRMFPILRGNNIQCGIMAAVSDITEKKLLEEELLKRKVQEQKNIIRAVLQAQEVERNKIGQELHDNVNQILASIRLYLELLEKNDTNRNTLLEKSKESLETVIREIRQLSRNQVTPQKTANLDLLVEELISDLSMVTSGSTYFTCEIDKNISLCDDLKLNVYRIIQEQVNNILKHAEATAAHVEIRSEQKKLRISITDNGKGFDPGMNRKGIGISNLINRVESYNGNVEIAAVAGAGCRINISIPLQAEADR